MIKRIVFIVLLAFSLPIFGQQAYFCEGDSIIVFKAAPSDSENLVEWEFILDNGAEVVGLTNEDSLMVKFTNSGDYILQFREYGSPTCYTAVEKEIKVFENPTADFTSDEVCIDDTVNFINTSSIPAGLQNSVWRIGNQTFDAFNFDYKFYELGDYLIELSITDNNGCSDRQSLTYSLLDPPRVDFYFSPEHPTTLDPEVSFVNISSSGNAVWTIDGDTLLSDWQPSFTFDTAGWHTVDLVVVDEQGCIDSISKNVLVESEILFFLPNTFSPDGDGLNDTYGAKIFNIERYQSFQFEVYNRWGEIIFYSNNPEYEWDGKTSKGTDAIMDKYSWSLKLTDELGKEVRSFGTVNLLR